ncbi:hypothetical protein CALVIDRAFT_554226 [Calocera viscosa TUFC12733]|uniref:N-acetyltransferase domain-containing protein n=1 Tax=Calocera viscosa (strain TUFC12733) TaxID=1330018 RepID=A0A167NGN7_CALVF|nr:hypothetical protein CALVIDRAFT_554226 [Calocera viscosa TUFC12733]
MSNSNVQIHIRRPVEPSEREIAGVLRLMRLAFARDPFVAVILAGDLSPEKLDAMNGGFVRAALLEGEGELWVAEAERPEWNGKREIVGEAVWFLPGNHALSHERASAEVWWEDLARLLGKKQGDWFLDYFLPHLGTIWERYLSTPGDTLDDGYHCQIISVLPEFHNSGIVSDLAAPVMIRAVREGKRVLGEATSAENMSKYEHMGSKAFGFEEFQPLPESGMGSVRLWPFEVPPHAFLEHPYWNRGKRGMSTSPSAKL